MTLSRSPPVGEGEQSRLIAWNLELRAAHQRLRRALRLARESLEAGDTASARADLLPYCKGFCDALDGHHVHEDVGLFPEPSARHPSLRHTIAELRQDHEMIAMPLGRLDLAITSDATPSEPAMHLDDLSAIMESHFHRTTSVGRSPLPP